MRPPHPNDVAKQAELMKLARDVLANSIAVASSVAQKTNGIVQSVSDTYPSTWRLEESDRLYLLAGDSALSD